jgi:hypothetical protein
VSKVMSNKRFGETFRITDGVMSVWEWLNASKVWAVQMGFNDEQRIALKKECDDLFRQVTGSPVCPAWMVGAGWVRRPYEK